jgi:hypothetical protein
MNRSNLFDLTEREEFMNLSFLKYKEDEELGYLDDFKLEESTSNADNVEAPVCKFVREPKNLQKVIQIPHSMKRLSPKKLKK